MCMIQEVETLLSYVISGGPNERPRCRRFESAAQMLPGPAPCVLRKLRRDAIILLNSDRTHAEVDEGSTNTLRGRGEVLELDLILLSNLLVRLRLTKVQARPKPIVV